MRIAVVDDSTTARLNLRNHMLNMDFQHISCCSHGGELKPLLRQHHYDLLLIDFDLGDHKNGVEVIQELQKIGLLKYRTCVVFVTADPMPMVISQIVDVHPDALILKPYTIRNLEKNLTACLALQNILKPVLTQMDEQAYSQALATLDTLITAPEHRRQHGEMIKLKGRLLIKNGYYERAIALYEAILQHSDKALWAKWGLIQSTFMAGNIAQSESMLVEMVGTHLTNDKACEWLTRIAISKHAYETAETHISGINEANLTLPAARLKAYLYQAQEKNQQAIALLERKRQNNLTIRERFAELSFDMARCYLNQAEGQEKDARSKELQAARSLIGSAARNNQDQGARLKRHYMLSLIAVLEGDGKKANELLSETGMAELTDAEVATMTDAVKAWYGVGDEKAASEILQQAERKSQNIEDLNERTIADMLVHQGQQQLGSVKERALRFNKQGMEFYVNGHVDDSLDYFYQAYSLIPTEAAFALNLLQALVDLQQAKHKKVRTLSLHGKLSGEKLSTGNKQRLRDIESDIRRNADAFVHQNQLTGQGALP